MVWKAYYHDPFFSGMLTSFKEKRGGGWRPNKNSCSTDCECVNRVLYKRREKGVRSHIKGQMCTIECNLLQCPVLRVRRRRRRWRKKQIGSDENDSSSLDEIGIHHLARNFSPTRPMTLRISAKDLCAVAAVCLCAYCVFPNLNGNGGWVDRHGHLSLYRDGNFRFFPNVWSLQPATLPI